MTDSGRDGERNGADGAQGPDHGPETAEIRTQEKVRTHNDRTEEGLDQREGRIQEALETAAAMAEETGGLGRPGRPVNRRSPFMIGMTGAFGVAVAYGLVELVIRARSVLIIIGLALLSLSAWIRSSAGWYGTAYPGGAPACGCVSGNSSVQPCAGPAVASMSTCWRERHRVSGGERGQHPGPGSWLVHCV